MKLKTSFFNPTVLKKDLTRFAPLWGLYAIFQLLFVLLIWESEGTPARFMNIASDIMQMMGILNLVYGGLCAFVLFGDLFNTRLCNALHALPMRREGWFLTHLASGALFCLIPNTLGALLAAAFLQQYCYGAFLWLGITLMQYLFFFSIGVFCVQCAGNRLGSIAMYALINFLPFLAAWLIDTFYLPVLYGLESDLAFFADLCPIYQFTESRYIQTSYNNMTSTTSFDSFIAQDWSFLFAAFGVGLLFLGASLLLYRKRQLESAGDFIAVRPAAPVFLILYTLCAGAVMYLVSDIMSTSGQYVFLVIGFAVGFFTGRMLLERKVNIFTKKSILGFVILTFCFFFSIFLTWIDPLGVTRYVPEVEKVQSVHINPGNYYVSSRGRDLEDPQDIAVVTQVHEAALAYRDTAIPDDTLPLHITYTMHNGTTVRRSYDIPIRNPSTELLRPLFSSVETVLGTNDIPSLLKRMTLLEFYPNFAEDPYVIMGTPAWVDVNDTAYDKERYNLRFALTQSFDKESVVTGLFAAIEADCQAGNLAQHWAYHAGDSRFGSITFQDSLGHYWDLNIYEDCTNTVNYIRSLMPQE